MWMSIAALALLAASILVFADGRARCAMLGWRAVPVRSAEVSAFRLIRASSPATEWMAGLYTPTFLTKIDSLYFIVDCWHNRILYSSTIDMPISGWQVLDDDLVAPHSIASDSVLYVVADTGRDRIRIYTHRDGGFQRVQTMDNLGLGPHRVAYDPASTAFYVLASESQSIAKLKRRTDRLELISQRSLPFLHDAYTRSFLISDGSMFFVSGEGIITRTTYLDDSYSVVKTYRVPHSLRSMNDLFKSGSYFYLTGTPRTIFRTTSLEALSEGKGQDIYKILGLKGTPYFLAEFDGRIFVPEIEEFSGIRSFAVRDGEIGEVKAVFESGPGKWMDKVVRYSELK
jgi:hypothetical protein